MKVLVYRRAPEKKRVRWKLACESNAGGSGVSSPPHFSLHLPFHISVIAHSWNGPAAGTWTLVIYHSDGTPQTGTSTPAAAGVTHFEVHFARLRAARARAQFLVKLQTFPARELIRRIAYTLAFDRIPLVVKRAGCSWFYTLATAVLFGVPLCLVVTICRFYRALAWTVSVVCHVDHGKFIWHVF